MNLKELFNALTKIFIKRTLPPQYQNGPYFYSFKQDTDGLMIIEYLEVYAYEDQDLMDEPIKIMGEDIPRRSELSMMFELILSGEEEI